MMRGLDIFLFIALSALLHVALFWQVRDDSGGGAAGEGGDASVSLLGASASVSAMVAEWERSPELDTEVSAITLPEQVDPIQLPPVSDATPSLQRSARALIEQTVPVPGPSAETAVISGLPPAHSMLAPDIAASASAPLVRQTAPRPAMAPVPEAGPRPQNSLRAALNAPEVNLSPRSDPVAKSRVARPMPPQPLRSSPQPDAPEVSKEAPNRSTSAPMSSFVPQPRPTRRNQPVEVARSNQVQPREVDSAPASAASADALASGDGGTPEAGSTGADEAIALSDGRISSLKRTWAAQIQRSLQRAQIYPRSARRRAIEGTARIVLKLGLNGSVVEARLSQGSGARMLDEAALASVARVGTFPAAPAGLEDTVHQFNVPMMFRIE